jgi:Zn-dependent peptidase ImmA (M78 family)
MRLRALTPPWPVSDRNARFVTERQAGLLLAASNVTAPPVPERIVADLAGIAVYRLPLPVEGVLSASQPSELGGDIIIDNRLPLAERRVTLMHELKHVIDGGHSAGSEALCADFAMNVLMPAPWLRADWQAGNHDVNALAERYQVPAEGMKHRLHMLGLEREPPRHRRVYCQWQPHTKNTKERRTTQ